MRRLAAILFATLALMLSSAVSASADPITCPPGQAATLNPSDGGWVCVNNGGNTNNSEDPRNDKFGKDKF